MSYIENVEMFDRFSRGEYVRDINKLNDTAIWLKPEDMDVIAEAISLMLHDRNNKEQAKALVKQLTEKYPLVG